MRAIWLLGFIAGCAGAGFRPHKHLGGGFEHSDLRIIGGIKTEAGKYPWMVMLGGSLPRCGGAAIDENWIVTAAHCVLNGAETGIISASPSQRVYFGCENIGSSSCQSRHVIDIRVSPCFDPCCDVADIALLKVNSPMNLGAKVAPVHGLNGVTFPGLEDAKGGKMKQEVTMMGWGSTCPSAASICAPSDLHEITLPVSTQAVCKQVNPVNTRVNSGHCGERNRCKALFDTGYVYCVGGSLADQGMHDSCNGDSGSPVAWYDAANTGKSSWVLSSWAPRSRTTTSDAALLADIR